MAHERARCPSCPASQRCLSLSQIILLHHQDCSYRAREMRRMCCFFGSDADDRTDKREPRPAQRSQSLASVASTTTLRDGHTPRLSLASTACPSSHNVSMNANSEQLETNDDPCGSDIADDDDSQYADVPAVEFLRQQQTKSADLAQSRQHNHRQGSSVPQEERS